MPRYWVVAPYHADRPQDWNRVWDFNLRNGVISIGWTELGDLTALDRDSLRSAVESTYKDKAAHIRTLYVNMISAFCNGITSGDIVLSRKGRKTIAAIGEVTGRAFHKAPSEIEQGSPDMPYKTHLPVKWLPAPRDLALDRVAFGMQTLYEISESQYAELLGGSQPPRFQAPDPDVQDPTEFVLEKYLEEFIATNFRAIFSGKLELYRDPEEGVIARQYATDVGPIDLLALDKATGGFVVIELKKGREADRVVGQTLRYMGWVAENLAKSDQQVNGMIICRDADPKLGYALKLVPSITVRYYNIDFKLKEQPSSTA
jgi:restriction system protein